MRVVLLKDFVKKNFPVTNVLNYAIEIEKITTSKVQENKFLGIRNYISHGRPFKNHKSLMCPFLPPLELVCENATFPTLL